MTSDSTNPIVKVDGQGDATPLPRFTLLEPKSANQRRLVSELYRASAREQFVKRQPRTRAQRRDYPLAVTRLQRAMNALWKAGLLVRERDDAGSVQDESGNGNVKGSAEPCKHARVQTFDVYFPGCTTPRSCMDCGFTWPAQPYAEEQPAAEPAAQEG